MKIGVYPFASTNNIADNLSRISSAIGQAAKEHVRLLVFHECALCGYPPVETSIDEIDNAEVESALAKISALAERHHMFIAVGTVRMEEGKRFNSIVLYDDGGRRIGHYDKMALWGWDQDNFKRGTSQGLFEIDGIKVGFRICFDVRFPELFRALYRQKADICFVCFSDTQTVPSPQRYQTIKAHLITRAMENVMTVVSVNSISNCQTAPTAVFDWNGTVRCEAETGRELLLVYDFERPEITFGERGRLENNEYFMTTSFSELSEFE